MIEVRKIGPGEKSAWNAYIDASPSSIAWQVYEWSTVVSRHYEYDFHPLAAYRGGSIVGVLPLYSGSLGNVSGFISVPFAVAGGIVGDDEEARTALLERACAMSREAENLPIVLKQYKVRITGDLKTDENYANRELSLDPDPAVMGSRVGPDNLKRAQSALKSGLEIEYPSADVKALYDLLLRSHSAQGVPCASEGWIRSLIDFGMYSFALGRLNGRVITATMIKKFKKTVSFPYSCVRPGDKEAGNAAFGLYWRLILGFASEGFQIFHSGRMPRSGGAADFRMGWGGTEYPYFYQYYPNTGGQTEFGRRRGLKRRIVSAMWKRLPRGIARSLGPKLVRRFP